MKTIPHSTAFPTGGGGVTSPPDGLTKREYFAAMALQGIMSYPKNSEGEIMNNWEITLLAVNCADELIKKLNE